MFEIGGILFVRGDEGFFDLGRHGARFSSCIYIYTQAYMDGKQRIGY